MTTASFMLATIPHVPRDGKWVSCQLVTTSARSGGAASLAPAGVPVVQLADLILLKLYAGGPQDGWDITQMLALPAGPAAIEDVEARLSPLPRSSAQLWTRIRTESGL